MKVLKMTDANTSGVKRHLKRYHEQEYKDIYFAPKSKVKIYRNIYFFNLKKI